eukprot:4146402-Prymnesium_polylepis.1
MQALAEASVTLAFLGAVKTDANKWIWCVARAVHRSQSVIAAPSQMFHPTTFLPCAPPQVRGRDQPGLLRGRPEPHD